MFVKATRSKGHDYLKIVESYREKGKSKHRTIVNLGRADILADSGLENIIKGLQKYLKRKDDEYNKIRDISTIEEKARVNYGYVTFQVLWNKYSLSELLNNLICIRKIEFDFVQTVLLMAINQLLRPSSKLFLFQSQKQYLNSQEEISLHHFYRTLDILADNKPAIENALFSKNRDLFNMQVDIVFYDVTTFHFESQRQDVLRDFGYSEAHKYNEVQVVLGMLIDCEGKPIGYELYPENTFDSKTLLKILKKLKEQFNLNQVIIVADKGINSKLNLKQIKDNGFDYIVSARIKNMKKSIQKKILSDKDYQRIGNNDLYYWREDFAPIDLQSEYFIGYKIHSLSGAIPAAYHDAGPRVEGKGAYIKISGWIPLASTFDYNFCIKAIAISQNLSGSNEIEVPTFVTSLGNNYPNPFNPQTTISFSLNENNFVKLEIFNIRGQLVKTLLSDNYDAGVHSAIWNGIDNRNNPVGSGIYLYKLETGNYSSTKKMILLK